MNSRHVYATGATLPIPLAEAGSKTPNWQEAQIALLHVEQSPHRKMLRLMASMCATLTIVDQKPGDGGAAGDALDTRDLIFFEVIGRFTPDAITTVRQIRAGSRVPIIVFTDALRPECTARALEAGADVVLALATAPAIVAARCSALLRRWQPYGMAPASLSAAGERRRALPAARLQPRTV